MITSIIVDDELPALLELEYLLKEQEDFQILGTYTDPLTALSQIVMKEPDAVFLDINMPIMDGFTLAEQLLKLRKKPQLIFVTAYDQYAIAAFDLNALDYILKPIIEERFEKTLARLRENLKLSTAIRPDPIETMLKEHRLTYPIAKLPLWRGDRIYLVNPGKILYCEALEGDLVIHTAKDVFYSQESLNDLENLLGNQRFFRCHRSFLINLDMVETIIPWFNNTYAVKLAGCDVEIPISRRNIKSFKTHFNL